MIMTGAGGSYGTNSYTYRSLEVPGTAVGTLERQES